MHRRSAFGWAWVIVASLLLSACGSTPQPGNARGPVRVVATIAPLADWVRQVGGARVVVTQFVAAGRDPRRYVPTDADGIAIQQADVLLLNGVSLEPWINQLIAAKANIRTMVIIDVSQFIGAQPEVRVVRRAQAPLVDEVPSNQRLAPAEQEETLLVPASPYVWLNPDTARQTVNLIAQTLARVDPAGWHLYRQNAARYNAEIDNLNNTIQRSIDQLPPTDFRDPQAFMQPFQNHFGLAVADDPVSVQGPASRVVVDALLMPQRSHALDVGPIIVPLDPLNNEQYLPLMRAFTQQLIQGLQA